MMIMEAFPFAVDISSVAQTKQGKQFILATASQQQEHSLLMQSSAIKVVSDWFKSL